MIRQRHIEYLFWILLILYSNPGGIQQAFGVYDLFGGTNLNDFIFLGLTLCFALVQKNFSNDIYFRRISVYLIIFALYYFFVFGYFTPGYKQIVFSAGLSFIKLRHSLYSILLFYYVYIFSQRSIELFLKIFLTSSIIIILVFLQSFLTGVDFLPLLVLSRGFINVDRFLLLSYGFLPLLIPIGIVYLLFSFKVEKSKMIYWGFLLMAITWLVSLTRRHIFGSFIYLLIGIIISNIIYKQKISRTIKSSLYVTLSVLLLLFFTSVFFPSYINAGKKAVEETINVIEEEETSVGQSDLRLSLYVPLISEAFYENPILGTGFDNDWRTGAGGDKGYQGSDYPFLSALAMVGIVGVLIFLPIYIIIVKMIVMDIKLLKQNGIDSSSIDSLLLIVFIIWFIFDLMKYMDWFLPISNAGQFLWYCCLGFYLGVRKNLRLNINSNYQ